MLKKYSYLIIILSAFCLLSFSPKKKKKATLFDDRSWGEVVKSAKEKELPIFVFISAPYCNVSRRMERVFKKPDMKKFLSANFVCKELDASNVFQNIRASNWGISAVPTYVIMDKEGKIIYKASGYKDIEQMKLEAGHTLEAMGILDKSIEEASVEK